MSESGGETYSQSYNTNATRTSPTAGWTQTGSGGESASSNFQYNYSGSGNGTASSDGSGDSLTISESGSGSGSQTYGYGGAFDDSIDEGTWSGTTTQSGSSQVQDSLQSTDNTDNSNDYSGTSTTTSTTNPSGPATITTTSTGAGASAPAGVSETTNASDQVNDPALWASSDYLAIPGGVPAVAGLYAAGNSIYVGIYGTPTLPASVPGTVGANGAVNSLVAQSLAPAAVDAVWGMANTPQTALKTAFAVGNTTGTASSEKLEGASAVFGTKNVAPFMPVTDAVFLADYGTHGVAAAPNAANFGSTFNGVVSAIGNAAWKATASIFHSYVSVATNAAEAGVIILLSGPVEDGTGERKSAEHTKGKRPSTEGKHQASEARKSAQEADAAKYIKKMEKEKLKGQREFEESKSVQVKLDELFTEAREKLTAEIKVKQTLEKKSGSARRVKLAEEIYELEKIENEIKTLANSPTAKRLERVAAALDDAKMASNSYLKSAANKLGFKIITFGSVALILGSWVATARAGDLPGANRDLSKNLLGSSPHPLLFTVGGLIDIYEEIDDKIEAEITRLKLKDAAQQQQYRFARRLAAAQTVSAYNLISKQLNISDPTKIDWAKIASALRIYHDKVLNAYNAIEPFSFDDLSHRPPNPGDVAGAAAGAPGLGDVIRYAMQVGLINSLLVEGVYLDELKAALAQAVNP